MNTQKKQILSIVLTVFDALLLLVMGIVFIEEPGDFAFILPIIATLAVSLYLQNDHRKMLKEKKLVEETLEKENVDMHFDRAAWDKSLTQHERRARNRSAQASKPIATETEQLSQDVEELQDLLQNDLKESNQAKSQ